MTDKPAISKPTSAKKTVTAPSEDAPETTAEKRWPTHFDYKDFKLLQRYINTYGQIESRRRTNLTAKQQRALATAIKRARQIALLPFVVH